MSTLGEVADGIQDTTAAFASIAELIGDNRDEHFINSSNLYYLLSTVIARQSALVDQLSKIH